MAVATTTLSLSNGLLTGMELGTAQTREILRLAANLKAHPERYGATLCGRFLALIFEKPSLRTRVTFEVGIASLGGSAVFLDYTGVRLGQRESIRDVARNLERWVHGIVLRTFAQAALEELAEHARIPVINALSDTFHPCQALADFFTLEEHFGNLRGLRVAYAGDGNNVCHSLLITAALCGAHLRVATPPGFAPQAAIVADAQRIARETKAKIEIITSPQQAVAGAQAVYTDVWAGMGQEQYAKERERVFSGYQINSELLGLAAPEAVFLHCLPAHRGREVTDQVMDSPSSLVFEQAENRLHVQKAILLTLLA